MPNRRHKVRKAPPVGTAYTKQYKGKSYTMKVVSQMGQTAYSVAGVVYKTPTAAANSISRTPINGWQFWGIESTRPAGRQGRPWSVKVSKA